MSVRKRRSPTGRTVGLRRGENCRETDLRDKSMISKPHTFVKSIKLIGTFDNDSKTAVVALASEVSR